MIEKFAGVRGLVLSEFFDLNHTSKSMIQVSLLVPKFAQHARGKGPANFGTGTLETCREFLESICDCRPA